MAPERPAQPLAGRGIVITRPAEQAAALAGLVRDRGGSPILFPALEILDAPAPAALEAAVDRLDLFDIAVFISPVAVECAMKAVARRRKRPEHLALAAVGSGSARALRRFGAAEVITPHGRFDSEGLLDLPELQTVAGKRVVIFRGQPGRELLGDTLRARGARVEYVQCYRRARPRADSGPLVEAWMRGELSAFVATSSEGLRNLDAMLGETDDRLLRATPLFVPHPRIASVARELGVAVVVQTQPGDEGIVEGLIEYFAR